MGLGFWIVRLIASPGVSLGDRAGRPGHVGPDDHARGLV